MALYNLKKIKFHFSFIGSVQFSSKIRKEVEYKKYYKLLEISECSDSEEIKNAYIRMVKKYHPDNNSAEASAEKFQEIDEAFRMLMDKELKENLLVDEANNPDEADIEHTAPQHRQYLSFEGLGFGNIFQREKQYMRHRALQASQNIMNHRLLKATGENETSLTTQGPAKQDIKTHQGLERLVEDLIQESMSKGHFKNLSGSGKPLNENRNKNPYVDFVMHKLNEILIDNGFTPEWISLQKEIRSDLEDFRNTLCRERVNFPPFPLTIEQNIKWSDKVYKHKQLVDEINTKINKYNLIVPVLQRQMLLVSLKNEAQNILIKGKSTKDIINNLITKERQDDSDKDDEGFGKFYKILESIFKK